MFNHPTWHGLLSVSTGPIYEEQFTEWQSPAIN